MSSLSSYRARGVAVLAASVLAAGLLGAGSATAAGAPDGPVTKSLTYTCPFPLIGNRTVKADISVTFPDSVKVGERLQATDFLVTVALDAETTGALRLIGAATVEGTATADVDVTVNDTGLGVTLNGLTLPSTSVPPSGELPVKITGTVPGLTVRKPGQVVFAVGQAFAGKITPRKADGTPTGLGTFDLPCTQDAGQDPALATIPVTG